MTPDEAIRAHREWKKRFLVAMASRQPMNVAEIRSDRCCKFGKWLYGELSSRFAGLPDYTACVDAHARFHVEAGKVAELVNEGRIHDANQMLGHDTAYGKASEELSVRVVALFKADPRG